MLRLASDEDVDGRIIRGLRRRQPNLDLVTVQEVGLDNTPDPDILKWAAGEGRILITRDRNTLVGAAWARVQAGEPMPGVLALRKSGGIRDAIDDILLVAEYETEDAINNQVWYIPLQS
jgi:hypothetical protein